MQYGLHFLSWADTYTQPELVSCMERAARLGAETFEVRPPDCVLLGETEKIRELRRGIAGTGLDVLFTFRYPADCDMCSADPASRKRAVAYMQRAIDGVAQAGGHEIGGIVYGIWPARFDDDLLTPENRHDRVMRSIDCMREVMPVAEANGVVLNCELLNRFEGYVMNTVAEGVAYCEAVGSPNCGLLLDMFHMNIEEDDIDSAIRNAARAGRIGHFHVCEANRQIPYHNGRFRWAEIGRALRESGYHGTVTLEPFLLFLGEATYHTKTWRDLLPARDLAYREAALKRGLDYIKNAFEGAPAE